MLLLAAGLFPQEMTSQDLSYAVSKKHPYGQPNPDAPPEIADFAPMIGTCQCKSLQRNPDQTWQDTMQMTWTWKYILNGMAIQDETSHSSGLHATSIRQFHPDSNQWVVSYASSPGVTTSPGVWLGARVGEDIVLSLPQKAPNGMDGFSTLRFYDISAEGFNWRGDWIKDDKAFTYPFWQIWCKKVSE